MRAAGAGYDNTADGYRRRVKSPTTPHEFNFDHKKEIREALEVGCTLYAAVVSRALNGAVSG